jgi:hypothetical protein
MTHLILPLVLVGAASLQACLPAPDCGAQALQGLVGQPLPAGFVHSGPLRMYQSGDMLTMDHREERLNIELSPTTGPQGGIVLSVRCG